jgi:hypothetical protein
VVSRRELECRRRRRERRLTLERLEREWVCGGPLVDHSETILSGGSGAEHAQYVMEEMQRRSVRMAQEAESLAWWFMHRCLLLKAERELHFWRMIVLWRSLPGPNAPPTWSTSTQARTLSGSTIPRL